MKKVGRNIHYRRAMWGPSGGDDRSLQTVLVEALEKLPNVDDTKVVLLEGLTLEVRHRNKDSNKTIYLHIAAYVPKDDASTVPHARGVPEADLGTLKPPEDSEFFDGDAMLRIEGNHLMICLSGLTENRVNWYLQQFILKAGNPEAAKDLAVEKPVDINKVGILQREGVKSVDFGMSLYRATADEITEGTRKGRKSFKEDVTKKLRDFLDSMIGRDKSVQDIMDYENVRAKLIITYDGRKKLGALEAEALNMLGAKMLLEDDDDIKIRTGRDNIISASELTLRRRIDFIKTGKTIAYIDAWKECDSYFDEINASDEIEL